MSLSATDRPKSSAVPKGLVPPVLTPLVDDDTLDESAFRRLLDHCIAGGVDGLFIGGTAGLGPLLPERVWHRTFEVALEHSARRLPLHAGVMETSTARAETRIRWLTRLGYKSIVLTPTYYIRTDDAATIRHFLTCADAAGFPLVAYNIPQCIGYGMSIETVLEMHASGAIHACKESSGDTDYFDELCRVGNAVGLGVLQGNRPDLARLHACGAEGIVTGPANVFPSGFANAWRDRAESPAVVQKHQTWIDSVWATLVHGGDFVSNNVFALQRLGIGSGHMLAPLARASEEARRNVEQILSSNPRVDAE